MAEKSKKEVPEIFRKVLVYYNTGAHNTFDLPMGIRNYHKIQPGNAIHCNVLELRKETTDESGKETGKFEAKILGIETLVDVNREDNHILRCSFNKGFYDERQLLKYDYALLEIKSIVGH